MNRYAVLMRIEELRDEIDFVVRQNKAYDLHYNHTIKDQALYVERMGRLEQIKRELADIKAGKILLKLIEVAKHLATDEQCFAYLERVQNRAPALGTAEPRRRRSNYLRKCKGLPNRNGLRIQIACSACHVSCPSGKSVFYCSDSVLN